MEGATAAGSVSRARASALRMLDEARVCAAGVDARAPHVGLPGTRGTVMTCLATCKEQSASVACSAMARKKPDIEIPEAEDAQPRSQYTIRLSEQEIDLIDRAATKKGHVRATWMRLVLVSVASRELGEG